MINNFYHNFVIGFNFWMVVAPMAVLFMAILGTKQHYAKRGAVRRKFNNKLFGFFSIVYSVIFGIMLFVESVVGIVQWLDNHIGFDNDPIYSILFAPVVIIGVAILFGVLLYNVAIVVSMLHEAKLSGRIASRVRQPQAPRYN